MTEIQRELVSGIQYASGYKYQLKKDYAVTTQLHGYEVRTEYASLCSTGWLIMYSRYAWDGASGPAIDGRWIMRGSLIHDTLYQMIREGKLPVSCRKAADEELRIACLQDSTGWFGIGRLHAQCVYYAVRMFGGYAVKKGAARKILTSP